MTTLPLIPHTIASVPDQAVEDGTLRDLRVLIAHEWLVTWAGSERCVAQLLEIFPQADLLVGVLDPGMRDLNETTRRAAETWLGKIPGAHRHHRWLLPLQALAFATVDTSGYDLVISSSHAFSKMIGRVEGPLHISYCYSPPRYLWDLKATYRAGANTLQRLALDLGSRPLRWLDRRSARGVDRFIAISRHVADRIHRVYGREASIVFPPVEAKPVAPVTARRDFLLSLGRLVRYKRVDLAVVAAERLGLHLVVAGDGPDRSRLEKLAGRHAEFVGEVSEADAGRLLGSCRAFVFCGDEDFGIAPVEANAHGAPVVAYRRGGLRESMVDGVTAEFFDRQDVDAVAAAMARAWDRDWDPAALRRNAQRFSPARFRAAFRETTLQVLQTAAPRHSRRRGALPVVHQAASREASRQTVDVVYASALWDSPTKVNCHFVAEGLARKRPVVFVESVGARRPRALEWRRALARLARSLRPIRRVSENVWVISPLPLPAYRKAGARLNARWVGAQVRALLATKRWRAEMCWIFHPMGAGIARSARARGVTYYCVDDYASNPGVDPEAIRSLEAEVVSLADLVVTTGPPLAERLSRWAERVVTLPNVADTRLFARRNGTARHPVLEALDAVPGPRIGYVGNLASYKVDFGLLGEIAHRRPDWSIVLVGPADLGSTSRAEERDRLPCNVHVLGPVPHDVVPAVIDRFDVALLPAARHEVMQASFPLKFFEYLLRGRPVVARPLPALRPFAGWYRQATDAEEFVCAIETALNGNDAGAWRVQREVARRFSWQGRMEELERLRGGVIDDLPAPRSHDC